MCDFPRCPRIFGLVDNRLLVAFDVFPVVVGGIVQPSPTPSLGRRMVQPGFGQCDALLGALVLKPKALKVADDLSEIRGGKGKQIWESGDERIENRQRYCSSCLVQEYNSDKVEGVRCKRLLNKAETWRR